MTPSPSREPVDPPVRDFTWFWQGATAALLALCAVIGLYEGLFIKELFSVICRDIR
jgi:hypothetical protein